MVFWLLLFNEISLLSRYYENSKRALALFFVAQSPFILDKCFVVPILCRNVDIRYVLLKYSLCIE